MPQCPPFGYASISTYMFNGLWDEHPAYVPVKYGTFAVSNQYAYAYKWNYFLFIICDYAYSAVMYSYLQLYTCEGVNVLKKS